MIEIRKSGYLRQEKELIKLLEADKIFFRKELINIEIDIKKGDQKYTFIINSGDILSNCDDKKLNKLFIKHLSKIIDLANYKLEDDEIKELVKMGYSLNWISVYLPTTHNQIQRIRKEN